MFCMRHIPCLYHQLIVHQGHHSNQIMSLLGIPLSITPISGHPKGHSSSCNQVYRQKRASACIVRICKIPPEGRGTSQERRFVVCVSVFYCLDAQVLPRQRTAEEVDKNISK